MHAKRLLKLLRERRQQGSKRGRRRHKVLQRCKGRQVGIQTPTPSCVYVCVVVDTQVNNFKQARHNHNDSHIHTDRQTQIYSKTSLQNTDQFQQLFCRRYSQKSLKYVTRI